MKINTNSDKKIYILVMAFLLVLQMGTLFYFGWKKAGFHEDELYTYYSSNKTAGLFVNDRQWMERDDLRNDFVVLPGEGFRYDVVWQMQSWDVHPPLYYFVFHTVCSLFPGVFSKWLGIAVNLLAYAGSYLLLAYCVYTAVLCGREEEESDRKRAELVSFLTCLFWGFSAAVISGVMFIRMYQQLTLFVLLCLALHLRAIRKQDFRVGSFLFPLAVTVFLGFLTQYYYIIFHFFLGAGFCVCLLFRLPVKKKVKGVIFYAAACAAGLGVALLYYPPALSHIFRGYRGTEAVSEFGDASNTVDRLRFFWGLFDDYVMNGTLSIWLLVMALLAVTAGYLKKKGKFSAKDLAGNGGDSAGSFAGSKGNPAVRLMLFTAAGYFFTVSKTALLLGETSNRYQLPVYGIWCFLLLYEVWSLAETLAGQKSGRFLEKEPIGKVSLGKVLTGVCCAVVLLINCTALGQGKVFFLYEEEKEIMEFVKSHKDVPVVVFYQDASTDHIWWLSDELMEYPRVYLASMGNEELIADETIAQSDSLLVYIADHEEEEKYLQGLLEVNRNLSSYQVVAEKSQGVWKLYEVK